MFKNRSLILLFTITVTLLSITYLWFANKNAPDSKDSIVDITVGLATIISSFASVMVGFSTIKSMDQQNKMQQLLIDIQQQEHQPIFVVKEHTSTGPDGKTHDHQNYTIENIGERVKKIEHIEKRSFINIVYHRYSSGKIEQIESYIPIVYYGIFSCTGNLKGEIEKSHCLDNHKKFCDIYFSAINRVEKPEVKLLNFFIIRYTDIYGNDKTTYIKNGALSSKEFYESVKKISETDYDNLIYNLNEVSIETFFNDCKQLKS